VNLGSLALNLLIIALFPAVVMGLARHRRGFRPFETWQLLFVGSLAAVIVVVTLLIARPTLPDEAVTRLAVVVAAEELSRLAGVIVAVRWQRRRTRQERGSAGDPATAAYNATPASAGKRRNPGRGMQPPTDSCGESSSAPDSSPSRICSTYLSLLHCSSLGQSPPGPCTLPAEGSTDTQPPKKTCAPKPAPTAGGDPRRFCRLLLPWPWAGIWPTTSLPAPLTKSSYFGSLRSHSAGWSSWQLVGLITRRSQVRVLPPLLKGRGTFGATPFLFPGIAGLET
jgi:hypothetical protein